MTPNPHIFNFSMTLAPGGKKNAPARTGAKDIFDDEFIYRTRARLLQQ
jgi:hypothetical protein